MLGRWLGLTPERPALCLRGFPRQPRVALSRVSDPPGLGTRRGVREPWGRLGGRYAKNVTICPTQACTTPSRKMSPSHRTPFSLAFLTVAPCCRKRRIGASPCADAVVRPDSQRAAGERHTSLLTRRHTIYLPWSRLWSRPLLPGGRAVLYVGRLCQRVEWSWRVPTSVDAWRSCRNPNASIHYSPHDTRAERFDDSGDCRERRPQRA